MLVDELSGTQIVVKTKCRRQVIDRPIFVRLLLLDEMSLGYLSWTNYRVRPIVAYSHAKCR